MLEVQNHVESFKESFSKRLKRHEDNFKSLVDKVK